MVKRGFFFFFLRFFFPHRKIVPSLSSFSPSFTRKFLSQAMSKYQDIDKLYDDLKL